MRVESTPCEAFTIFDAPRLDPITVVLQDFGGGQGRILIECWGMAWSSYWGAMGGSLRDFLRGTGTDYVANRLTPNDRRTTAKERAYMERIVDAVLSALRTQQEAACTPAT